MQTNWLLQLEKRKDIKVIKNAEMAAYTSFQIGGPADFLVQPETVDAFLFCYRLLNEAGVPIAVMGAGSNLLVADTGFRGVVIHFAKHFSRVEQQGEMLVAEAGVSLARLAGVALSAGLSGLEFASGIPGSLGGAVYMNAGAYGGEMKDVVTETEYITAEGVLNTVQGADHDFGYRQSIFNKTGGVILRSKLCLTKGDPAVIRGTMQQLNSQRKEKQPLQYPSAGSFFKRPAGSFAGKLIEEAGLKGVQIGGAQISEKHAGFLINTGGATAADVCALMCHVQNKVFEKFGVKLEPEVRFLGEV